jgi:DNA-binding XRE family transcriptional regulator
LIAEFASGKNLMQQKEFQLKLGQQIAKLRKQKKLSQVDFAYMLDKEKQNYNKIEKGKSNTTSWTLYKIAELLEVPVQKLFDWE